MSATTRKVELPRQTPEGGAVLSANSLNPRRMRRIVAEDPTWNLDRVPSLLNICIRQIVNNFKHSPIVDQLPPEFAQRVLDDLPVSLPLDLAMKIIHDDGYWKRAATAMSPQVHDVSKHGHSWKRLFFEKYIQNLIEAYVPGKSAEEPLHRALVLARDYVVQLNISTLQPPSKATVEQVLAPHALPDELRLQSIQQNSGKDASALIHLLDDPNLHADQSRSKEAPPPEEEEEEDDDDDTIVADHLDIGAVAEQLPHLESLQLCYRVRTPQITNYCCDPINSVMRHDCEQWSCKRNETSTNILLGDTLFMPWIN
eukprot:m.93346 g.93346  ORF g.93346 m.93346 type:complete len:313 (+) comp14695_c5_seq1:215-1153(+)